MISVSKVSAFVLEGLARFAEDPAVLSLDSHVDWLVEHEYTDATAIREAFSLFREALSETAAQSDWLRVSLNIPLPGSRRLRTKGPVFEKPLSCWDRRTPPLIFLERRTSSDRASRSERYSKPISINFPIESSGFVVAEYDTFRTPGEADFSRVFWFRHYNDN
jgi:hypothetical protein